MKLLRVKHWYADVYLVEFEHKTYAMPVEFDNQLIGGISCISGPPEFFQDTDKLLQHMTNVEFQQFMKELWAALRAASVQKFRSDSWYWFWMQSQYRAVLIPPRIDASRLKVLEQPVNLLWWEDWYDGPLEGMAEYEGRHCWFTIADDSQDHKPGLGGYALIELTGDQYQELQGRHDLYVKHCGLGMDNVPHSAVEGPTPDVYYDLCKAWKPVNLTQNPIAGRFR